MITDYLTTYYVTIHQDDSGFSIPLNRIVNRYPVRVGFACASGSAYEYDYSQLSYDDIANKDFIENIANVYPIYNSFVTTAETLESRWQTSGQITYSNNSDDTSIPTYSQRGIFPYVLHTVASHPVMECRNWINGAAMLSNINKTKECPTAESQAFIISTAVRTDGDYKILSLKPTDFSGSERLQCMYSTGTSNVQAGTFVGTNAHASVGGLNIYR